MIYWIAWLIMCPIVWFFWPTKVIGKKYIKLVKKDSAIFCSNHQTNSDPIIYKVKVKPTVKIIDDNIAEVYSVTEKEPTLNVEISIQDFENPEKLYTDRITYAWYVKELDKIYEDYGTELEESNSAGYNVEDIDKNIIKLERTVPGTTFIYTCVVKNILSTEIAQDEASFTVLFY